MKEYWCWYLKLKCNTKCSTTNVSSIFVEHIYTSIDAFASTSSLATAKLEENAIWGAVRALSEQSMSFPCITGPLWGSRWDPDVTFGKVLIHRWLRQNSSDYFTHIVQCRHVKKPQSWPSRILFRSTHRMESNYSRSYFSERVLFEPGKYKHHPNLQSNPFVSYGNVIGSEK